MGRGVRNLGHMTKMAPTPIFGKNLNKYSPEPKSPMTSQGHNFHKLLFSTFQKYYILDDGGKVSVLW